MLQDLRYALRSLASRPGFASLAVLTMALGIGANTAIFSLADSVLFRRLPFRDADRLFVLRIANANTKEVYGGPLPAGVLGAARESGLFDGVAPASTRTWRAYLRGPQGLEALPLSPATREYLDLLGIRVAIGRTFDASDTGTHAVILSHRAWMGRYGGDPAIVGRQVPAILRPTERYPLVGQPLHVIGVLPARLQLPLLAASDGLVLDDTIAGESGSTWAPLVRLSSGIDPRAAQSRVQALQLPQLTNRALTLRLVPVRDEMARRQDAVLWLLIGAAAIVLAVGCVNLANLIIARGAARSRELAVRAALGGSRARLARLLLVEASCLAALGTVAGIGVGYAGFRVLARALPPLLLAVVQPVFDSRALGFALLVALAATAVVSIIPVWRMSRADAREGLSATLQRFVPVRRGRHVLVGVEVAICLALLVGAGLVGRSLASLATQELGFEPRRYAVNFDLPTLVVQQGDTLRTDTAARSAFYIARLRDIRAVPGVRAAALASSPPFSGSMPDYPLTGGKGDDAGGVYSVSGGYFRTLGIPLLAGRDFTDDESLNNAPLGVLNERAARMLCGSPRECLGRAIPAPDQPVRTIIGVVADARQSLQRRAQPAMFVPFTSQFALKTLVIDADLGPRTREQLAQALSVSRDARVDLQALDDARDRELSPLRFNAIVVGGFAALTLVLAAIGVFGVMAAIVVERMREYGIRVALGATRERVVRLVLRQAGLPIACGAVAGLVLAAWGSRFLSALLFGVTPLDRLSFAAAAIVVISSGVGAALLPALRAGGVDPIVVLKTE